MHSRLNSYPRHRKHYRLWLSISFNFQTTNESRCVQFLYLNIFEFAHAPTNSWVTHYSRVTHEPLLMSHALLTSHSRATTHESRHYSRVTHEPLLTSHSLLTSHYSRVTHEPLLTSHYSRVADLENSYWKNTDRKWSGSPLFSPLPFLNFPTFRSTNHAELQTGGKKTMLN